MADSSVNEIKDRLEIVDIVSGYIKLNKAGRNFKALCPFHSEKSPSFMVNPERQIWHCFGCGEGGDIFSFIMKMDGLEFPEALKLLAEKAGVELKKNDFKTNGQKNQILDILETAADFYQETLNESEEGKSAIEYLRDRGMSDESIKEWRIGFSPDSWRGTFEHLLKRGFRPADIFAAGLAIDKSNNQGQGSNASAEQRYYDRFRGRVMFPISDITGHVIGFGGRIFSAERKESGKATERNDAAKYINTPQTSVYNKSRVLYGLDKAKSTVAKADFCILVEGYTDVIASRQAGIKNVVSSSGTALTIEQLRLMKRYTDNLVIAYDMDLAGEGATRRGIELALEEGFNIKVPRLPNDQDPADCIKDDPNIWIEAIKNKKPIMDYYFEDAFSRFNEKEISGKKNIYNFLVPVLAKITNQVERDIYRKKLSAMLDIDEKELLEEIKKIKPEKRDRFSAKEDTRSKIQKDFSSGNTAELEEILIGLGIAFIEEARDAFLKIDLDVYLDPAIRGAAEKLTFFYKKDFPAGGKAEDEENFWQKEFLKDFSDEEKQALNLLAFRAEELYKDKGVNIEEEINKVYANLMRQRLSVKLKKLENDIKKAEANGDKEASSILSKEFMDISMKKNLFNDQLTNIKQF